MAFLAPFCKRGNEATELREPYPKAPCSVVPVLQGSQNPTAFLPGKKKLRG